MFSWSPIVGVEVLSLRKRILARLCAGPEGQGTKSISERESRGAGRHLPDKNETYGRGFYEEPSAESVSSKFN